MNQKTLDAIVAKVAAGNAGKVRTAGKIEFIRDQGPVRRDIRAPGFQWSPEAMRDLAKVLWAAQQAHTYTMAAYRVFSKMHSSGFSPDGLLGGRGYIQAIKDMRSGLGQAAEVLSAFSDTVQDELNGDHWKNSTADPVADELIQNAEETKANPGQVVEEAYEEVAPGDSYEEPITNPSPDEYNPQYEDPAASTEEQDAESSGDTSQQQQYASGPQRNFPLRDCPPHGAREFKPKSVSSLKKEDEGSQLPTDKSELPGDTSEQGYGKTEAEMAMNTVTLDHGAYASVIDKELDSLLDKFNVRRASSSVPVETLPGPRINHIGPAEGNESGGFNDADEMWASDDPSGSALSSGVNDTNMIYEDAAADGVTPYTDPTEGDNSVLSISSRIARQNYSWLPGSRNEKLMNYYQRGLTDADVDWMRSHDNPDPPEGMEVASEDDYTNLWEVSL